MGIQKSWSPLFSEFLLKKFVIMANYEEPLSPAARIFRRPLWNCYIISIMGFHNTCFNPNAIKAHLQLTLLNHPRFSSILVDNPKSGKPKWTPTTVDIENHVIVPTLNPKISSPDQYIDDYISDIAKTPMDISQPLWELHLLHVQTSYANSVAIFRFHHSIGDCASLTSLLLASTRKTGIPDLGPTIPVLKRAGWNYSAGLFWWINEFLIFLMMMWNTMINGLIYIATVIFFKDSESPVKNITRREFTTKQFVHRTVSLDNIKLVKKFMNMTINDVLMGVTEAGLSRYMNRRYGEDGNDEGVMSKESNNIPKDIRLRAAVVFNLRPTAGVQNLKEMMKKNSKAKWGNKIGYVLFPFSISVENDPLDHLRRSKAIMDQKKLSFEALSSYIVLNFLVRFLHVQAASYVFRRVISNTTMTISNVVGPTEGISFDGNPIQYLATSIYGHSHALTIHFQSYINKMTIALSVDPFVIPDADQLCDDLVDSLGIITEAVVKEKEMMIKDFV